MADPGWYPDPELEQTQRYWDGVQWTEHRAPAVPATSAVPASGVTASGVPSGMATVGKPPRLRPDGRPRGPSLGVSLATLIVGVALGIASVAIIVPGFVDSLSGPRWSVPGSNRVDLDTGEWVIYERVDFRGYASILPSDVAVSGPSVVLPQGSGGGSETLTINERQYVEAVRFDVSASGTYEVTVRGEPSFRGEVLLARPLTNVLSYWPWFLALGLAGLLVVAGVVMWIIGAVNRGRAARAGVGG